MRISDYDYKEATDLGKYYNGLGHLGTIVDLGAGKRDSPISFQIASLKCDKLISVEAFQPYTLFLEGASSADAHIIVNQNIMDFIFPDNVDLVLLIDVIEHLKKEEALALIDVLKANSRWIVIFTPEGDTVGYSNKDSGNILQEHLSAWSADEVESLGFEVTVYEKFHTHVKDEPIGAMWAIYNKT